MSSGAGVVTTEVETARQQEEAGDATVRPIKLGKYPRLEFYSFMTLLSGLTTVDVLASDFVKAMSEMTHRGYIAESFGRARALLRWNYKIQDAVRLVATTLPKSEFRQHLERFSQAIAAGMRLSDFCRVESSKYMIQYDAEYSRIIDRLRQVSETFSALLSAVSFLAVSMMISSMTFGFGNPLTVLLSTGVAIGGVIFAMLFLIRAYCPKELSLFQGSHRPFNLDRFHAMNRPFLIAGVVVGLVLPGVLFASSPFFFSNIQYAIGVPMIVAGVPLYLFARVARKRIRTISQIEEQFPAFVKNFGDAFAITASSRETLRVLKGSDYGALTGPISSLYARLKAGIDSRLGWRLLAEESGSYMIQYHTDALLDALTLGARAPLASDAVFSSITASQGRKKKRELVSSFLRATVVPLQITFAAVLTMVQAIVQIFSKIATLASTYLVLLTPIPQYLIVYYTYAVIASTLFGTALGIAMVDGESEFDLTYNMGFQLLICGAIVGVAAIGASLLLGQFNGVTAGVTL